MLVAEGEGRWQDYAGGYTDMVAQRGAGVSARRVEQDRADPMREAKVVNVGQARAAKEKLSFKDKHALDTLPKTIAQLDGKKAKLKKVLDDAGLYARDPAGSPRRRRRWPGSRPRWRRRRIPGWSWRCAARRWRGSAPACHSGARSANPEPVCSHAAEL